MLTTRQAAALVGFYILSVAAAFVLGGGSRAINDIMGVQRALERESKEMGDLERRVSELKKSCFSDAI